jgi:hypothetical protein
MTERTTKYSTNELLEFVDRSKRAQQSGRLMDLLMPNGKKLEDCTFSEVDEVAEQLTELGDKGRIASELLRDIN